MNEGNNKRNRPKSQIMVPNSTSPIPKKNGSSDSLPNHRYENEWELRSKELAEAKARVAQMEKTMRWWSDCTDNWRKKWSEVKTERNELRKEVRLTKHQLEKLMKQFKIKELQEESSRDQLVGAMGSTVRENGYAKTKHSAETQTTTSLVRNSQMSLIDKEIVSLLEEKVAHLTCKLDEVNRRLLTEREEKAHLQLTIERLGRDLSDLNELYDSLKKELSDLNGKEFTESEIESYAEEEGGEDLKLITGSGEEEDEERLLLNDEDDEDDSEYPEEEQDDKHTPTGESTHHHKNPNLTTADLTSTTIHVEISAVHKKLDLKTFIDDV